MAWYKNSSSLDAAARDENGAAYLHYPGARDAARNNDDESQYHYFSAPTTEGQDEHGAAYAYVFSDARTAAHRRNDAAAAAYLYHPGARDATKHGGGGATTYQHHYYSGAPTTEGQDEHGAAYAFSDARTAIPLIDGGAADIFPGAHPAAPTKNGAPYMFSDVHVPTAAETKDDVGCLYPSVHADAASHVKNGAPVIFSGVRAAGYYNSGVVAGETLPIASQVFGAKTTSVPAIAVAQDKVAGTFTERLRRGLPVLGLSLASLAVTGLAAVEPTTAAGFGLFLMLIVGLSAVTIRALRD